MLCCSFLTQNTTTQLCNSKAKTSGAVSSVFLSSYLLHPPPQISISVGQLFLQHTALASLNEGLIHMSQKKDISRTYLLKYSHYSPPKSKIFGFVCSVLRWMFLVKEEMTKQKTKNPARGMSREYKLKNAWKFWQIIVFQKCLWTLRLHDELQCQGADTLIPVQTKKITYISNLSTLQ